MRYSIYYGHVRPPGTHLPSHGVQGLLHQIARRIRAHEHEPPPAGM